MKLTELERHMAYMIMLAELEEYKKTRRNSEIARDGFCWLMFHLFSMEDMCSSFYYSMQYFPEIESKRPDNCDDSSLWWESNEYGGVDYRLAALRQCITETEDAWPK